jgi:hypothetical protein
MYLLIWDLFFFCPILILVVELHTLVNILETIYFLDLFYLYRLYLLVHEYIQVRHHPALF